MENTLKIDLKICGITSFHSIVTAAKNDIRSLGFASNNLHGPNTCDDKLIKKLIQECDHYKIDSVLLSRYHTLAELIKQIDYTKPKTISCSYFFEKNNLHSLKTIFRRLRIGIAVNPKKFDMEYFDSIKSLVNVFYYDLNVYDKNNITTYSLNDCLNQIMSLKELKRPVYIGGCINFKNAKKIVNSTHPDGLDVSRSLKDKDNNISSTKLSELVTSLLAA
jgi:phosphoribosylanthranilate isomerase